MSFPLETLASYVPLWVVRRLALNPTPPDQPVAERFQAAVLFADISGFTPLAERLAKRSSSGAEDLSRVLNAYFGQLIELIMAHGGDVIKFAGDALLTLWPVANSTARSASTRAAGAAPGQAPKCADSLTLPEATLRATQCALAIQSKLHHYEAGEDIRLSMRIGIGAGEVSGVHTGGEHGRWEFLIAGPALGQMSLANHQAEPGQVVLSPQAWALVQPRCTPATALAAVTARPSDGILVKAVHTPLPASPTWQPTLTSAMETTLKMYLPGAIQARLEAGQSDWLAEQRRVTVLFVSLPAVPAALELAQIIMRAMQIILYRYQGSIRQFIVDDKGAAIIAVLGLPPLAHEDDAARGVLAAMEMSAELRRLGLRGAIGVTSGEAFCGIVGNRRRREYAIIGDVVNLAARLMQAAASQPTEKKRLLILCDEATCRAARAQIEFESLPEISVKGKANPLPVFRPVERKKVVLRPRTALVGRSQERMALAEALQSLLMKARAPDAPLMSQDNSPAGNPVIILEGEAGIGKSRLIQELYRQAEAFRITTLYGGGNAIEHATPYYAWRLIFEQVFNLAGEMTLPEASTGQRAAYILECLEKLDAQLVALAPLLNPVLLVDLPDSTLTAQMNGQVRADNTHDLLLRLLQDASPSPKLIILEDAQWMDPASWGLAAMVSRKVSPLLLAIATRPLGVGWQLESESPPGYQQLTQTPGAYHIRLTELKGEETLELVCQRLGVTSLSEPLANLVHKAEGHPFFAEELAYALRDSDLLRISGDVCDLAAGAGDWRSLELPHTVQGAITSRIDRLAPGEQLTLKAASVIGRVFDVDLLRHIYPIEDDRVHLASYLNHLEQLDLTVRLSPDSSSDYVFKHAITCDVVYKLMPYTQRQALHRAVAEHYEQTHPEHFYHGLLVHHWSQAGDIPKALDYLEKAGEEAVRNGAHQEAIHILEQALSLFNPPVPAEEGTLADSAPAVELRPARWERWLAQAHWEAGNVTASFMHARRALEYLKQSQPVTTTGLLSSIAKQALMQSLHRLAPDRFLGERQGDLARLEIRHAYHQVQAIHYLNNQSLQSLNATLHALNLAESVAPRSLELAVDYANTCLALGVLSLHPLAAAYGRLAQQAAQAASVLPARAYVLQTTGVYEMGMGRWRTAQSALEESILLYDDLGNWRSLGEGVNLLALLNYYRGELGRMLEFGQQEHKLGVQRANPQLQTWGLNLQAMQALYTGQLEQAIRLLETAWGLLTQYNLDRTTAILNRGVLAVAHLRQGRLRSAREVVYNVARLVGQARPVWVTAFDGYVAIAQVYLGLWEADVQDPEWELSVLKARAFKACQALGNYARAFAIGQPRACLYQGWYHYLAGHTYRAQRAWQASLAWAQRLDMPYEQGLAYYEMGRHANGARQRQHLATASEIFERLGARCDLVNTQLALDKER